LKLGRGGSSAQCLNRRDWGAGTVTAASLSQSRVQVTVTVNPPGRLGVQWRHGGTDRPGSRARHPGGATLAGPARVRIFRCGSLSGRGRRHLRIRTPPLPSSVVSGAAAPSPGRVRARLAALPCQSVARPGSGPGARGAAAAAAAAAGGPGQIRAFQVRVRL
jgi:hypothetical protein